MPKTSRICCNIFIILYADRRIALQINLDDYDIEPYRKSVTCAQQKSTTEVKMEANNVDATVDFVDFGVRKQDSATGEGQSDAKPGIENETLLHTLRASSKSAVENKQVLPEFTRS
jgi:hypothetical protein